MGGEEEEGLGGKIGGCRGGGWGLGGHGWRLDVVWDGVGWGDV